MLAVVLGLGVPVPTSAGVPAAGHADSTTAAATVAARPADLVEAYARGRGLPVGVVGGIRPGSLHAVEVSATGTDWAVASFLPAASASTRDQARFQSGAGNALFRKAVGDGEWKLAQSRTQPACTDLIPDDVKSALGLAGPAARDCAAGTARPTAAAKAAATGTDLRSGIASIALGQVGVATTPAESDFGSVDCDPYSTLDAAFSPNANGCGPDAAHRVQNQNEAWCSDFAKWVWAQAGVTADMNTLNAGSVSFYAWALGQGQHPAADSGTPEVGDAVVFFSPGVISANRYSDHVGIVTAVHADGTVDMVNGDFLGADGITVQYDQNVNLTPWAASIWGAGEQWVLISPPSTAQQPAPTAAIVAPTTASAGTTVRFSGIAAVPGGTIAQYYWTFGDGRDGNVTGQSVSHVFQRAGLYTVTMSATSSFGTVTTKTWNVGVSAASSAVSSVPNTSVWYTTDPVMQYSFTAEGDGGLAVDSWDGAAWLQQTEPGRLAGAAGSTGATGPSSLTSLTYADAAAGYATVPHAYYRTAAGTLGETFPGANGWAATELPGNPAAGSAIAALAANPASGGATPGLAATPSVFFFDASGALNQTTEGTDGTWTDSVPDLPRTSNPAALAVTTAAGPLNAAEVFYIDRAGKLTSAASLGGRWVNLPVNDALGIRPDSPLAAATIDGGVDVFFVDQAGKLAAASSPVPGVWSAREIGGMPTGDSTLTAVNHLVSGTATDEVFWLAGGGTPTVTARSGPGWETTSLPGTATAVTAASSNTVPGMPEQAFLTADGRLSVDTLPAGGSWTNSPLPSTPTSYPGTVLLYAATPQDAATAQSAAAFGGLLPTQVTTDFAQAWAATLSGDYLVVAVGPAAVNALYDNPCGWANPSNDDPGSTPFYNVERPLDVPLTNLFLVAEAKDPTQTPTVADDMAYFAVHGALPAGAVLPKLAYPGHTCLGTPA